MTVNDMVKGKDWRVYEMLKRLRQCVTCPRCGALVSTDEGGTVHIAWHDAIDAYIGSVDNNFQTIDVYVRGAGGMEDQIRTAIAQLRADATSAITQLRTDTTTAISAIQPKVGVIAIGGASVPSVAAGVQGTIPVTLKPAFSDTAFQVAAFITGSPALIGGLSVLSATVTSPSTVDVVIKNTSTGTLPAATVLVVAIHS